MNLLLGAIDFCGCELTCNIVTTKANYLLNSININLYQYIIVLKIGGLKLC